MYIVHFTARGLYYAAALVLCTRLAERRLYDLIRQSKWREQPDCTSFSSFERLQDSSNDTDEINAMTCR